MISLSNLTIKNYKSCLGTSLELDSKLTALIGVNGVGKSNILTAIKLLSRIRTNRYYNTHNKSVNDSLSCSEIETGLFIDKIEHKLKIKLFYETDQNNHDEVFEAKFQIKKSGEKKWINLDSELVQFLYRFGDKFPSSFDEHLSKRYTSKENYHLDKKLTKAVITFFSSISYYGATHFADPSKCPNSIELEDSRPISAYRPGKTHDKFLFDLYTLWKVRAKNSNFDKFINLVNKEGVGLVDSIDFVETKLPTSSYEITTGGKMKTIKKNKDIVIPIISLDGLTLSPNQLSEGTFKTLALIFYIINNDTSLLIIEEPEVCIHHGLLSSIVELIKSESKYKQIIISTHSDYVLDKLKPENILLISRNLTKGTQAKSLTKSLSKNDYRALKYYLDNTGSLGEYWKEGGIKHE